MTRARRRRVHVVYERSRWLNDGTASLTQVQRVIGGRMHRRRVSLERGAGTGHRVVLRYGAGR